MEVINALGLEKPLLIGNSCGGGILHTLGGQHPEHLAGLVYLDAAEDPTLRMEDYDAPHVDWARVPASARRPATIPLPPAELRQRPLDPAIRRAIVDDNKVRPDYSRISVPVLAIYRTVRMEQALRDYPPKNDDERAAMKQAHAAGMAMLARWQRDLRTGVPNARIVELPGANLYMFLSHEAEVIREVRAFATTLDR